MHLFSEAVEFVCNAGDDVSPTAGRLLFCSSAFLRIVDRMEKIECLSPVIVTHTHSEVEAEFKLRSRGSSVC